MHLFDIIIFALITFFLVQRLRSVLGQRVDIDPATHTDTASDVKSSIRRQPVVEVTDQEELPSIDISTAAQSQLPKLRQWDKSFTVDNFYSGAVKAFRIILKAYAEGNVPPLAFLSTPDVLKKFTYLIEERQRKNLTQYLEIVGFLKVSVEQIDIQDNRASITLHFLTEQTNVTKNAQGDVTQGTLNLIEEIEDVWTFQKDKSDSQDIWKLCALTSKVK